MRKAKKLAPRTERRAARHKAEKLSRARERLAAHEPGGAPDRPIDVRSASLVEVLALEQPCLRCNTERQRLIDHAATEIDGERLRVVDVACSRCGSKRRLYFRIGGPKPN